MDLLAAWLLFPVVLAGVSLGIGLAIERASGRRLHGALLMPIGLAGALAASRLLLAFPATARLMLPALLVLALSGAVLGWRRVRSARPDMAAVLAAVGVFVVAGAPIYLGGSPSFGGSRSLPDTSHQLALASFLPEHGLDWQALEPSSHRLNLEKYIVSAYPVAPQATLGALSPLGVLDTAWLYQPYLSFILAMFALSLYALLAGAVRRRWDRALIAFVAGQPALVVSFALQGSVKEISALAMIALTAALAAASIRERWSARGFLALVVSSVAALGALGPAAGAYLGPILLVSAGMWVVRVARNPGRRELIVAMGVMVLGVAVLLPVIDTARTAYDVNTATLEASEDLGNLPAPLELGQATGVWLNGDFRYPPSERKAPLTDALVVLIALSALVGLGWALRRRAVGPLMMVVPVALTSAYLLRRGSPYADAKVLCLLAPAVLTAALFGAVCIWRSGWRLRFLGPAAAAVIGLGVLGSNALIYHEVQAAPYERYSELLDIGDRLEGKGPTLLTDYDEMSQYLLRKALPYTQPEWPHGYRPGALDDPRLRPSLKTPIDPDHLTNPYLQSLSAVVIRPSPTSSRPPANFERTWTGRYYEIWRPRSESSLKVVRHLPLGANVFQPGGPAPCSAVRRLGRMARARGGRLAFVRRPRLFRVDPTGLPPVDGWFEFGDYPDALVPNGPGRLVDRLKLPAGRFRLWIEGEYGRGVSVLVAGHERGEVAYETGNPGQYFPVGSVQLNGDIRRVEILRGGGSLRPGNGGGGDSSLRHVGALVFSPPQNERRQVRTVSPDAANTLCGRWLDWIEVVVPADRARLR